MPNEQDVGQLIGHMLQILESDPKHIDALCIFLEGLHDILLTPVALKSTIADNRIHVLFDLLQRLNIVTHNTNSSGFVILDRVPWLRQHLYLVLGAYKISNHIVTNTSSLELAWTLPEQLINATLIEPVSRSLASLIVHGIARSQKELFLVSPFLDLPGAELLSGSIHGAWKRGVQVYMISHGPSFSTDTVISVYKRAAPNIRIFYAPTIEAGEKYLLLHAKLVIADRTFAVLGSANLTSYGLDTHLEIGIGVEGPVVLQLRKLTDAIMASGLVNEVI